MGKPSSLRLHRPPSGGRIPLKDLDDFLDFLLGWLDRLDESLGCDPVSLRWTAEAMDLLKELQLNLLSLLKKCKLVPSSRAQGAACLDQYMQDTVAVLDFCNSLKFATSWVDHHRLMVDVLIERLGSAPRTFEFDASRIESRSDLGFGVMVEVVQLGNSITADGCKDDENITVAMVAAKSATVVVSLLVSAAVSPVEIEPGDGDLPVVFPRLGRLSEKLATLARGFQERLSGAAKGTGSVLAEQEKVGKAVAEVRARVVGGEMFLSSKELLRTASAELREGIGKFDAAVDGVFDVVMRGRNEMLAAQG